MSNFPIAIDKQITSMTTAIVTVKFAARRKSSIAQGEKPKILLQPEFIYSSETQTRCTTVTGLVLTISLPKRGRYLLLVQP